MNFPMWPFHRKYLLTESKVFQGFTDWHSHILPGVDDGIRTMEEALDILALYEKVGIKAVWLTPHVMEDMPNTTIRLKERFKELVSAYKGTVRLCLAAEYMLDNLFRERLDCNDLLPLGEDENLLLVETSYYNPPTDLFQLLARIKARGYYPVLAHPERYMYMDRHDYEELKDMDVKFQLNVLSLAGMYGKEAKIKAGWLLENSFYSLAGTDLHSKSALQIQVSYCELKKMQRIKHMVRNFKFKR